MWVELKQYEGKYWIDELGNIKDNKDKLKRLFTTPTCDYLCVCLNKDGHKKTHLVHRLVANQFIDNPENKPQVNHIDKNKKNNNVDNLEWVTPVENMKHHYDTGGIKRNNQTYKGKFGKDHNRSIKITCNGVIYNGLSEASRMTGIPISTIHYGIKYDLVVKHMYFQKCTFS